MKNGDLVVFNGEVGKVITEYGIPNIRKFLPAGYGLYSSYELNTIIESDIQYATFEDKIKYIKKEFSWGKIRKVHIIEDYQIIECISDSPHKGQTHFHSYIDFNSTSHSCLTLEQAIVDVIAYKFDGANSQAAMFFSKMIGLDEYANSKIIMDKIAE